MYIINLNKNVISIEAFQIFYYVLDKNNEFIIILRISKILTEQGILMRVDPMIFWAMI